MSAIGVRLNGPLEILENYTTNFRTTLAARAQYSPSLRNLPSAVALYSLTCKGYLWYHFKDQGVKICHI